MTVVIDYIIDYVDNNGIELYIYTYILHIRKEKWKKTTKRNVATQLSEVCIAQMEFVESGSISVIPVLLRYFFSQSMSNITFFYSFKYCHVKSRLYIYCLLLLIIVMGRNLDNYDNWDGCCWKWYSTLTSLGCLGFFLYKENTHQSWWAWESTVSFDSLKEKTEVPCCKNNNNNSLLSVERV